MRRECHSCVGVFLPASRKAHIGYHSENVVAIFFIERHGLLIVSRKEHFRAASHSEHSLMIIESLGRELHRLLQEVFKQVRQHRRVKAYGVFYEQYSLDADIENIVVGVHAVFNKFYYGQYQVNVTKP